MSGEEIISFVKSSTARQDVVLRLADGDADSKTLVDANEASESTTYDAIGKLDDRGLIDEVAERRWTLTGTGRMVADLLERCHRLDQVMSSNADYWQRHDPTGLPERFRRDLDYLAGCRVIESPDADPYRAARRIKTAIEDATDQVLVIAPIYDERRAEAFLTCGADTRRILMTPDVVERLLRDDPEQPDRPADGLEIRVSDANVAVVLTESELLFSLPTATGTFDATTEVYADGDTALDWAERLFETLWSGAPTVETFVAEQWPELVSEINR